MCFQENNLLAYLFIYNNKLNNKTIHYSVVILLSFSAIDLLLHIGIVKSIK